MPMMKHKYCKSLATYETRGNGVDYSHFLIYNSGWKSLLHMVNIPLSIRRVAIMIGILVLVFVVLDFNRRVEELNMLNEQNRLVQTQATQAVQTQEIGRASC